MCTTAYDITRQYPQVNQYTGIDEEAAVAIRGVATGVYRYIYIYPSKSVYLTNFYVVTGCCVFIFDPGQIRYRASVRLSSCFFYLLTHHNLYPPPNEIPGYAPGGYIAGRGAYHASASY